MSSLIRRLRLKKVLVSDGAWGTFLQAKGLKPGECPELWNLDRPLDVLNIAESYIHAGSDVIETNSFGGSSITLERFGLKDHAFEINKAAAMISRKAAGPEHLVMGSIGPSGKILMTEEISPDELYEAFREQALALEEGGADVIVIETMTDLQEALIALKAVKENTRLETICTMTFDRTVSGEFRTMMGVSPEEMTKELAGAGADMIGTNCGHGMNDMEGIVKEIRKTNDRIPVIVQGNAGVPEYRNGQTVYPLSPDEFAGCILPLLAAGASVVGGCCGTLPEHISKIRKVVDGRIAS